MDLWNHLGNNLIGEKHFQLNNMIVPKTVFSFYNSSKDSLDRIYSTMDNFIQSNKVFSKQMLLEKENECFENIKVEFYNENQKDKGTFNLNDFYNGLVKVKEMKGSENHEFQGQEKSIRMIVEKEHRFKTYRGKTAQTNRTNLKRTRLKKQARKKVGLYISLIGNSSFVSIKTVISIDY